MTLTETRPEHDEAEAAAVEPAAALDRVLGSGDHKVIGRLWIGFGALYLVAALVVALIAGIEHVDLGSFSVVDDQDMFTQLWSLGRDLLFFGAIVPMFVGLATYIVPLQVGSSSIAFPRGAAAAFWVWLISTVILILSYILNGGPSGGRVDFVVLWTLSLGAIVGAIVWAMVCIATTVLGTRATGMTLDRVPITTWSFFVFSLGGIFTLPILMGELLLGYLDVRYGYLPTKESRAALLSVLDSVSLAPAVYWLAVPTLGVAVEAIGTHTGRPIRLHRTMLVVLGLLGIVAFGADFLSFAGRGRPVAFDNGLMVVAILTALVVVVAVLGLAGDSLKSGSFNLRTPLVAALSAGLVLVAAAAASILALVDPTVGFIENVFSTEIDLDSAFFLNRSALHEGVRGLVLGAGVLGLIAGVHHWGHKIWGRSLDDRLGLLATLASVLGAGLWGIPLVVTGFLEQDQFPFVTADPNSGVEALNGVSVAGLGLLIIGGLLLAVGVLAAAFGRGSAVEPWTGYGLEWLTTSPPPEGNFESAPIVSSTTPALDALDQRNAEVEGEPVPATGEEGASA